MSFFAGIAFDDQTRAVFGAALDKARPLVRVAKWEQPEKAHLTLVFLGECDPELPAQRLREVVPAHAPLTLHFEGSGVFDRRVLWLGVGGDLEPLRALQLQLEVALEKPHDHGVYTPHVTLARGKGLDPAAQALRDFRSPPFRVDRVTLFESRGGKYAAREVARLARGETV